MVTKQTMYRDGYQRVMELSEEQRPEIGITQKAIGDCEEMGWQLLKAYFLGALGALKELKKQKKEKANDYEGEHEHERGAGTTGGGGHR